MSSPLIADVVRPASSPSSRDRRPPTALAAEVRDGLSRRLRELPTRFLDERATADVRRAIEQRRDLRLQLLEAPLVAAWAAAHRSSRDIRRVVQLVPGGSHSVMPLLDAPADRLPVGGYLAIDTHPDPAAEAAERVVGRYPELTAFPLVSSLTLPLPVRRSSSTVFAMLGGALGRFTPVVAVRVLRSLRAVMAPDDRLLLGLDLRPASMRATAAEAMHSLLTAWHRHVLVATNRAVGTNLDPEQFRYRARIVDDDRRLDEGLECVSQAHVVGPNIDHFTLDRGDHVRTAVQHTYDKTMVHTMLRGVGLSLDQWSESPDRTQALAIASVRLFDDGQP